MMRSDARPHRGRGLVPRPVRCSGSGRPISEGDDILLYGDEVRSKPIATLHTCGNSFRAAKAVPISRSPISWRHARAAWPTTSRLMVTAGIGEDEVAERFKRRERRLFRDHVKALADRLAEAFAPTRHPPALRRNLGFHPKPCRFR